MPNYSIIHKQDIFITEKYRPDTGKDDLSFLSRSFERHFNERPYLNHTCYLFLTKTTKERSRQQSKYAVSEVSGAERDTGQRDNGAFHGVGGTVREYC